MNFPDFLLENEKTVLFLTKINKQIATNAALVAIDEPNTTIIADAIADAIDQIRTIEEQVYDWLDIDVPVSQVVNYPQALEMAPKKIKWVPYTSKINELRKFYKEFTPDVPIRTITAEGTNSESQPNSGIFVSNDSFAQGLFDLDSQFAIINSSLDLLFANV